jgi:flagellar basal body-associated protein FliL
MACRRQGGRRKTVAPKKAAAEAPAKRQRGHRGPSAGERAASIALRFVVPAVVIAAAIGLLVMFWTGQKAEAPELRAAIVDQLGMSEPNPQFVQTVTTTLEQAGYAVDYYPPEQVTVDFYRQLPSQKYVLIVFRVHIARFDEQNLTIDDPVRRQAIINAFSASAFLFTSEQYDSSKYPDDRENLRLFAVRNLAGSGDIRYFGISPRFIKVMQGSFQKAVMILMGCDGLLFDGTAQAFVDKGAGAVIGWDSLVSGPHTDKATQALIQKLVAEGLPVGEAIRRTMAEVGSEPAYGNSLKVYPANAGGRTLPRG